MRLPESAREHRGKSIYITKMPCSVQATGPIFIYCIAAQQDMITGPAPAFVMSTHPVSFLSDSRYRAGGGEVHGRTPKCPIYREV